LIASRQVEGGAGRVASDIIIRSWPRFAGAKR
jgi:hypothetical protein